MHERVRARLVAAAAAALLVVPLTPASGATDDLEQVRAQRAGVQQRLDEAAAELSALQTRAAELEARRDQLHAERERLQEDLAAASDRIATRVRALYKRGGVGLDPLLGVLAGDSVADVAERAALVQHMVIGDQAASESAAASRVKLEALAGRLTAEEEALAAAIEEQRAVTARIQADLEEAAALESRLEERARAERAAAQRRAEAAARVAQANRDAAVRAAGGLACPVAAPRSYTDSWGAARSGGRSHAGTDILARHGADVYAVVGGTVDIRRRHRLAGNWLILRGVDGHDYYYIHLQGFAVADGARVDAGELIAFNGDTGNAAGTPHVHFEYHPGGGGAVNPYALVRQLCG